MGRGTTGGGCIPCARGAPCSVFAASCRDCDVKICNGRGSEEVHLALYLQHLAETVTSKSAVEEAVNAIGWAHQLAGLPPVVGSPFVKATLGGLQRQLARPKVRKEPITVEMLGALVEKLGVTPSLADVRLAASALLASAAFLRYDELAYLRCCDVTFTGDSMSVHIISSKTDQYREEATVLVARTHSPTCPVAMMEKYYSMAALPPASIRCVYSAV